MLCRAGTGGDVRRAVRAGRVIDSAEARGACEMADGGIQGDGGRAAYVSKKVFDRTDWRRKNEGDAASNSSLVGGAGCACKASKYR